MKSSPFICIECRQAVLETAGSRLACPHCGAVFASRLEIPLLLPAAYAEEALPAAGKQITLASLQETYDRAYEHDGLMGTDLDQEYDRVTKEKLLSFASPLAGKRLLDVGAGTGNLWNYISEPVEGYALDLSVMGMARAHRRHPHLTVSVSVAEVIPYPDRFFDVVLAADTIEHTIAPNEALAHSPRLSLFQTPYGNGAGINCGIIPRMSVFYFAWSGYCSSVHCFSAGQIFSR